jgi:hypothetical protein
MARGKTHESSLDLESRTGGPVDVGERTCF